MKPKFSVGETGDDGSGPEYKNLPWLNWFSTSAQFDREPGAGAGPPLLGRGHGDAGRGVGARGTVVRNLFRARLIAMPLLSITLGALGVYLVIGLLLAVPFVQAGVKRIDPHATRGSWGFRLLILPGTMFLWPLLAHC